MTALVDLVSVMSTAAAVWGAVIVLALAISLFTLSALPLVVFGAAADGLVRQVGYAVLDRIQ